MSGPTGKVRPFIHRWRSAVFNSGREPATRLDPTARLVCLVLAEFAKTDGTDCFPSGETVARLAGLDQKAARRALKRAAEFGWCVRTERQGFGHGWAQTCYTLTMPKGADPTPARSTMKGADSVTTPSARRSGLSVRKVCPLRPKRVGATPDEQEELTGRANRKDDSVHSDGSDAAPWTTALAMLRKSGLQEAKARSIIGKARKILKNDDAILMELVGIAERGRFVEPGAWLLAAATKRATTPRRVSAPIPRASAAEAEASADAALARLEVARHE